MSSAIKTNISSQGNIYTCVLTIGHRSRLVQVSQGVCKVDFSNHTRPIDYIPMAGAILDASNKAHDVSNIDNFNWTQPTSDEVVSDQITILESFERWDRGDDGEREG